MNISFALTTQQVRDRLKWVTRRLNWLRLKKGDILIACEKCQGLGKGGKIVVICKIRVVSVRRERLDRMLTDLPYGFKEVAAEGFPDMHPAQFVDFFIRTHGKVRPSSLVSRIEFEYVDEAADDAAAKVAVSNTIAAAQQVELFQAAD